MLNLINLISIVILFLVISWKVITILFAINDQNMIETAFEGREKLSKQDFYEKYFSNLNVRKEVPIKIREILEEHLDIDLSKLSSEDSFDKELRFMVEMDSWIDHELIVAIEHEFDFEFLDTDTEIMTNIHDIVMGTEKKLKEKENSIQL